MSALNIPWSTQATVIVAVARKYNIPIAALLGIYGVETSFGTNVTTSSAGAVGPFQFIQSTAAQYHYPYTNTPTVTQFGQQADAWGRLLVANNPSRNPNGWAPAMGGGYSEAYANSKLSQIPSGLKDAIGAAIAQAGLNVPGVTPGPGSIGGVANTVGSAANSVANTVGGVASGIGNIADLVTSTQFWLRLGEALLGVMLLILGLRALTGGDGNPVHAAKSVGKKAAMVAFV